MTDKERWLNTVECKPIDRLVFWPKLDAAYPYRYREKYGDISLLEYHDYIESDKHIYVNNIFKDVGKNTKVSVTRAKSKEITKYETKYGITESVNQFDKESQSWHPIKMPINNEKEINIMIEWYKDTRTEPDAEKIEQAKSIVKNIGTSGIAVVELDESPLMKFVEWLAGVENAHYLLVDNKELVEELFNNIHNKIKRKIEITCKYSPIDLIYMVENTSTTLITPYQFRKYCYPLLQEYAEIAKSLNTKLGYHMCGHLKDILKDLSTLKGICFEAFSSPPIGNVKLPYGRKIITDKCLIGGTNAVLWTKSTREIIEEIEIDLDNMTHHRGIAITSGGVMTPLASPETIKEVCSWVKSYKPKM